MSYWVYENWRAESKAKVHRGSCGHCNEGKGAHPDSTDGRNGEWHGPFKTREEADAAARKTGRPVSTCGTCMPATE